MRKYLAIMAIALVSVQAFAKVETKEVESTNENGDKIVTTTTYDTKKVLAAKPGEHWYLNIGIGAQCYVGDNDYRAPFLDWWTAPAVEIYAGKWFTPVWGLHFGVNGYRFRGLGEAGAYFNTDEIVEGLNGKYYFVQNGYDMGMFIMGDCNLINLFGGNRLKSVYDLTLGLGGGYLLGWDKQTFVHSPMVCFEINNVFNITKHFGLYLKFAGNMVGDHFDGEGGNLSSKDGVKYTINTPLDGLFSATVGATFSFGSREWVPAAMTQTVQRVNDDKAVSESVAALAASEEALASTLRERDELARRLKDLEHSLALLNGRQVKVWYHAHFFLDKYDVTERERVNLSVVANFIKANPGVKYTLSGYADEQTATPEYNLRLAGKRIDAVKDVLVKEFGVNPDQLVGDNHGGVDNMFYDDNSLSRCVIISTDAK